MVYTGGLCRWFFIKLPATVYIIIPSLMLLLPFARAWYKIMIFANVFMYSRGIFANICMYPRGIFGFP